MDLQSCPEEPTSLPHFAASGLLLEKQLDPRLTPISINSCVKDQEKRKVNLLALVRINFLNRDRQGNNHERTLSSDKGLTLEIPWILVVRIYIDEVAPETHKITISR